MVSCCRDQSLAPEMGHMRQTVLWEGWPSPIEGGVTQRMETTIRCMPREWTYSARLAVTRCRLHSLSPVCACVLHVGPWCSGSCFTDASVLLQDGAL